MPVTKYVCVRDCYHRRKRYYVGDPYTPLRGESVNSIPHHFEQKDVYEEKKAQEEDEAEQDALTEALHPGEELDLSEATTFSEITEKQQEADKAAMPEDTVL